MFFEGSGRECRQITQDLNMKKRDSDSVHTEERNETNQLNSNQENNGVGHVVNQYDDGNASKKKSRWSSFVDSNDHDQDSDLDVDEGSVYVTELPVAAPKRKKQKTNKFKL